jgi:hypothetical protein
MISEPTVFILGAGASWHYGYPTGDELVSCVVQMAERFSKYCTHRMNPETSWTAGIPEYVQLKYDRNEGTQGAYEAWRLTRDECEDLKRRLTTVQPVVIDFFLSWNEHLQGIGKLLIAAVILEREAEWRERRRNGNRLSKREDIPDRPEPAEPDPWYRFVTHWLLHGCRESRQLLENKVKFVTFNYDVSLDTSLYEALSSHSVLTDEDIRSFLSDDRIVHVYGAVRSHKYIASPTFLPSQHFRQLGMSSTGGLEPRRILDAQSLIDRAYEASNGIRTIDIHKEDNNPQLERAAASVRDAARIYLLGYGFEPANSKRIGLDALRNGNSTGDRTLAFTNYYNHGTINNAARKLLPGLSSDFAKEEPHIFTVCLDANAGKYITIQKSSRSVYDALSKDFEPPQ